MTDKQLEQALGVKEWGIFPHSIDNQPTDRGVVARAIDPQTGRAVDGRNYGALTPIRTFKRAHAAERHAMKVTFGSNYYAA